jgi:putative Flp pilus-assembly TadE/G-like protein
MRTTFSRLRDERGSALIAAGIMAASFVLLGSVVVEVGQWLSHRRHIQVRADAAALAGGQQMVECFNSSFAAQAGTDMENKASDYAGITSSKNIQGLDQGTGEQSLISFQGTKYPDQQGVTRDLGPECSNLMLDVKMAETGIPKFFGFSPLVSVHGWARVQAQKIVSLTPTLPLAIPDVRPKQVAVTFVNNATGAALAGCPNGCVFPLAGPTQSGQLNVWGSNATIPIPAANSNVGMRVGIGAQVGSCAAGANQTTYRCYDNSGPGGVIDLRSYSTAAGTQTAPALQAVTPTTCSGTPYFSIYQATNGTCSASVTATVNWGATGPPANAKVRATVNGTNLVLTNSGNNTWVSNSISLPIEGGPYPVRMGWCVGTCTGNNAFTNFNGGNPVQQIFSGSDDSSALLPGGPIFAASVIDTNAASPNPVAYSFVQNQSATVAVSVGLAGGVHLPVTCPSPPALTGAGYRCATDPPILLRFTTGSGNDSQTYAIDCGGGSNLRDQIEQGCTDPYSINDPDICPDPANPTPTDCATVQTGAATGQVQQGMNYRFTVNHDSVTCDPNNYPNPGPPPTPIDKDPRAVTLIITDFSAFSGSGGSQASDVPVVTFATFYVTGWDGAPASCNGKNEPAPSTDTSNGQGSNIWGHFIADIKLGAVPSGEVCVAGVTPCAIALTR